MKRLYHRVVVCLPLLEKCQFSKVFISLWFFFLVHFLLLKSFLTKKKKREKTLITKNRNESGVITTYITGEKRDRVEYYGPFYAKKLDNFNKMNSSKPFQKI